MADAILPFLQALKEADQLFRRQRRAELGGGPAGADGVKGGGAYADLEVGEHAEQVAAFGMEGVAEREDLLAVAGRDALAEVGDLLGRGESVDGKHVGFRDLLAGE